MGWYERLKQKSSGPVASYLSDALNSDLVAFLLAVFGKHAESTDVKTRAGVFYIFLATRNAQRTTPHSALTFPRSPPASQRRPQPCPRSSRA
jgi:hypothetical protein